MSIWGLSIRVELVSIKVSVENYYSFSGFRMIDCRGYVYSKVVGLVFCFDGVGGYRCYGDRDCRIRGCEMVFFVNV